MKTLKKDHGNALVGVIILAVIANLVFVAVFFSVSSSVKRSGTNRVKTTALNVAEAGKEHLYTQIRNGIYVLQPNTVQQPFTNTTFGSGSYTVRCSTNAAADTLFIRTNGSKENSTKNISVVACIVPKMNFAFPPVRGAITARSNIVVKGNISIDGRDYDTAGILIGNGTYGVSTCGTLALEGSAAVGGNGTAPVDWKGLPGVQTIVARESAPAESTLQSPEKFLGIPDGSLDSYKSTTLVTPFRALKYITSDYVGPVHFDSSYGILIVHNAARNAELQLNDGVFKGLIIADKMAKISGNVQIFGAVVCLADSVVSTFGTGTADIKYSRLVLENLSKYCTNVEKKINEIAWKEY